MTGDAPPGRRAAGALPQVPPGNIRRGQGTGPRHRAAPAGAAQRPGAPCLPVQRAARLRQDLECPDPGPLAQLRAGADARSVRRLRVLHLARPGRTRQHRRDRDRRGLARRRRRCPRPARTGLLRPGGRPLQDLHHRRSPHGHQGGLQRAAQAGGGAAAAPEVRVRDHRAGEGHRDHQVADAPLPVPAGAAGGAARAPGADPGQREGAVRAVGAADRDQGRRRLGAGRAVGARPADGGLGGGRACATTGPSRCSATPTTGCWTRSSRRSRPATARPFSTPSITWWRPGTIPAGSPPTCWTGCATSSCCARCPTPASTGLIDAPADRLEQMSGQAAAFGQARLTRAAEVISAGLIEMRGATSPRLLLELMCAQVLLPASGTDTAALAERLDRLERRLSAGPRPEARAPGAAGGDRSRSRRAPGQRGRGMLRQQPLRPRRPGRRLPRQPRRLPRPARRRRTGRARRPRPGSGRPRRRPGRRSRPRRSRQRPRRRSRPSPARRPIPSHCGPGGPTYLKRFRARSASPGCS